MKALQPHYICLLPALGGFVELNRGLSDWARGVEAEENAVLVSIPSVEDGTLAPAGHGCSAGT